MASPQLSAATLVRLEQLGEPPHLLAIELRILAEDGHHADHVDFGSTKQVVQQRFRRSIGDTLPPQASVDVNVNRHSASSLGGDSREDVADWRVDHWGDVPPDRLS